MGKGIFLGTSWLWGLCSVSKSCTGEMLHIQLLVSFPDPNNPSEDCLQYILQAIFAGVVTASNLRWGCYCKQSSLGLFRSGNETTQVAEYRSYIQ